MKYTWTGEVDSLHIAANKGVSTSSVNEIRVIPGKGIEGDRHFISDGYDDPRYKPDSEITFIEIEAVEALHRDYNTQIDPGETRRNIVTRGVPLNHLVSKEFMVGNVSFRGIDLCEPCSHLGGLTGQHVYEGLIHRGGLRAQILNEGTILPGDIIKPNR